jgi:hypothetical protein
MIARLVESTQSFDRAMIIASYSALLFVQWNSSLAAYLSLMPDGEVRIAMILALADPHAPFVCTVHTSSVTPVVLWVSGVQSMMKSTRA